MLLIFQISKVIGSEIGFYFNKFKGQSMSEQNFPDNTLYELDAELKDDADESS